MLSAPARPDPLPNFGLLALVVAAGGLLSGLFLALNFAPTLDAARASVAYIEQQVLLGAFLRGLHHWAGNFAIVLAALHGWRVFWHGAYKPPRRTVWWLGCALFLVLVGFAYTGYLLPGDERAYTGMKVMEGIAGATPLVGDQAAALVRGGGGVSSATMTRLYVVHTMVLPAALLLLLAAFAAAWRRAGPARHSADDSSDLAPAGATLRRDATASIAVLAALGLCAWLLPPALGPEPDFGGAGSPDARPEWFLLWVNQLLHWIPGAKFLIGGLLPPLLVGLALALPLLARGTERAPARRKPELIVAGAILAGLGGLTVAGWASAPEPEAPPPAEANDEAPAADDDAALAVMARFKCADCHTIDGDAEGGATGPPLNREGFGELYTERFFRQKVGDPIAFWEDTGMRYKPRKRKPTEADLDRLVAYFYGR